MTKLLSRGDQRELFLGLHGHFSGSSITRGRYQGTTTRQGTASRPSITDRRDARRCKKNSKGQTMSKTAGNLILMTLICIMVFMVFMAMRPMPAASRAMSVVSNYHLPLVY